MLNKTAYTTAKQALASAETELQDATQARDEAQARLEAAAGTYATAKAALDEERAQLAEEAAAG